MSSTDTWICDECQSENSWHTCPPLERQGMDRIGMFCTMKCFSDFAYGLVAAGISVGLRPGEEPDVVS